MTRAKIEAAPFDAFAAYQREREHARVIERLLVDAIHLLRHEASYRKGRGDSAEHLELFIQRATQA
jgi:hypothetical protein